MLELFRSGTFDVWLRELRDIRALVVLLLCGGDKRTQDADIKRAIEIAEDWEI
jgi:putative component of toxin-antitoxin plasmid stabilization module